MQFKLELGAPVTDLPRLQAALLSLDPAALVDIDDAGTRLRVASILDAEALYRLVAGAGYPVERSRIVGVPSECCGGCGG
jgi:hypothetical protein